MTEAPKPGAATDELPWSVAKLAATMRDYIGRLGSVWIEGEITQWSVSAGNVYGRLKDLNEDVTVSFNMWSSTRAKFSEDFNQGDRVVIRVKPNYWVKGGTLSFVVSEVKKAGLGALLEQIEKLKRQLAEEGLFDLSRKKKLPFLPGKIGLITGKDSDAEKDVLRNAQLRWPEVQFRIEYAAVQGNRTVPEVLSALAILDSDPEVDVIIIARGGGDFQHLLGFSDESLVRAVAAASTPIVSAIGHEADRPILDEVADLRASTPTDAAKRVVPDVAEELTRIQQAKFTLYNRSNMLLKHEISLLQSLRTRPALAHPFWIIDERTDDLQRALDRGRELLGRGFETQTLYQRELLSKLIALSPKSTLDRGYAIVQKSDSSLVTDPIQIDKNEQLKITVSAGQFFANTSETPLETPLNPPAAENTGQKSGN